MDTPDQDSPEPDDVPTSPQQVIDRVRAFCGLLPETVELELLDNRVFRVAAVTFATYDVVDDRPLVSVKLGREDQMLLVRHDGFAPTPDIGEHGWTQIDVVEVDDWEQVDQLLVRAYRAVAPSHLIASLDFLMRAADDPTDDGGDASVDVLPDGSTSAASSTSEAEPASVPSPTVPEGPGEPDTSTTDEDSGFRPTMAAPGTVTWPRRSLRFSAAGFGEPEPGPLEESPSRRGVMVLDVADEAYEKVMAALATWLKEHPQVREYQLFESDL